MNLLLQVAVITNSVWAFMGLALVIKHSRCESLQS